MAWSSPASMRVASFSAEVMYLGLRNWQQPKIRCNLRGSNVRWVSDGEAVLHGQMSGISIRYSLSMSDG